MYICNHIVTQINCDDGGIKLLLLLLLLLFFIIYYYQNHKVVLLDKAALEEKDNIMCGAKLIINKESELCEVIKQFEETISKLESNVVTAKREVSRVAEEVIAGARARSNRLPQGNTRVNTWANQLG